MVSGSRPARVAAAPAGRAHERGFTLVEALVAIVVLVFGLIAVTNLMIVGASTNMLANQSTAAAEAAAQRLEMLKSTPWDTLVAQAGGSVTADIGATSQPTGNTPATQGCIQAAANTYNCNDAIASVGVIHTRWQILYPLPGFAQGMFIRVRSERLRGMQGAVPLLDARSRAEFTVFRSCVDNTRGCPVAP